MSDEKPAKAMTVVSTADSGLSGPSGTRPLSNELQDGSVTAAGIRSGVLNVGPYKGKYIKIHVPNFNEATGTDVPLGSYLRIGAIEDPSTAGKAPYKLQSPTSKTAGTYGVPTSSTDKSTAYPAGPQGVVGLVGDKHGNPLQMDPHLDPALYLTPYPNQPDPSGEDLASLVQGFADDSRNRGYSELSTSDTADGKPSLKMETDGTAGGQPWSPGTTAVGPMFGYPQAASTKVTDDYFTLPDTDVSAPAYPKDPKGTEGTAPSKAGDAPIGPGLAPDQVPTAGPGIKPPAYPDDDYRALESSILHTKGGWRDHSDGNRVTTTRGDKIEVIRGNYKLVVMGRQDQTKSKLAGMDISGGQSDTGGTDLTCDASTAQDPYSTTLANIFEWKKLKGDSQYRSYSTTKKGSGPKVSKIPQGAITIKDGPSFPAVTPDGHTFQQPMSGSVSINETWSWLTYNYSGIGYARNLGLLDPTKGPGSLSPAPDDTNDPSDPTVDPSAIPALNTLISDYVIWPAAKTINKTYVWDQTSETYANTTWTLTAGPRTSSPVPTTTTEPGSPYDPPIGLDIEGSGCGVDPSAFDYLPPVKAPGTKLGNYAKVKSITTETHVSSQYTYLVADNTTSETHVGGEQHSVSNVTTNVTENNIGAQSTVNNVGAQSTITNVGAQSAITNAGTTSAITNALATSSITNVGVAAAVTANLMNIAIKLILEQINITLGSIDIEIKTTADTGIHVERTVMHASKTEISATDTKVAGSTVTSKSPAGSVQLASMSIFG